MSGRTLSRLLRHPLMIFSAGLLAALLAPRQGWVYPRLWETLSLIALLSFLALLLWSLATDSGVRRTPCSTDACTRKNHES